MNSYVPKLAKIVKIKKEAPDVKTFRFRLIDNSRLSFIPGQVIMVSVFGIGEATFGIVPTENSREYEFSVKKVGSVTKALLELKANDMIGIRGPFGNGYPMKRLKGKNILLIAGGIGFPPIKSLLLTLLKKRKSYKRIELYYGAKTPEDIVYKKELKAWSKMEDIKVRIIVDKATKGWRGDVGVVTNILEDAEIDNKTIVLMCGPGIMMKFVTLKLKEKGLRENQIYASMERLMQCGLGVCGHCNIGGLYVCKDGPVFRVDDLFKLTEKPW
ncbi:MAG: FAD/NAD(P)-binding protein [Candidatus Heimdallarchaeota archaeon]